MAAPMEVSLPQTMLQKLLDLLQLESLKFCLKIHVHVIRHIRYQVNIDYHNQHESTALIGLFHMTSLVLPSVESYPNYQKPTQRGIQGTSAESTFSLKMKDSPFKQNFIKNPHGKQNLSFFMSSITKRKDVT